MIRSSPALILLPPRLACAARCRRRDLGPAFSVESVGGHLAELAVHLLPDLLQKFAAHDRPLGSRRSRGDAQGNVRRLRHAVHIATRLRAVAGMPSEFIVGHLRQ